MPADAAVKEERSWLGTRFGRLYTPSMRGGSENPRMSLLDGVGPLGNLLSTPALHGDGRPLEWAGPSVERSWMRGRDGDCSRGGNQVKGNNAGGARPQTAAEVARPRLVRLRVALDALPAAPKEESAGSASSSCRLPLLRCERRSCFRLPKCYPVDKRNASPATALASERIRARSRRAKMPSC